MLHALIDAIFEKLYRTKRSYYQPQESFQFVSQFWQHGCGFPNFCGEVNIYLDSKINEEEFDLPEFPFLLKLESLKNTYTGKDFGGKLSLVWLEIQELLSYINRLRKKLNRLASLEEDTQF